MRIGVTLRQSFNANTLEYRDSLALDWQAFFKAFSVEYLPILLPNWGETTVQYAKALQVEALLLTGGEDWGVTPIRDETETLLIEAAEKANWPILGVCRGAQVLQRYYGSPSSRLHDLQQRHIQQEHLVDYDLENLARCGIVGLPPRRWVNSFHRWGVLEETLSNEFFVLARAQDGTVEAFARQSAKKPLVMGILWHPERKCSLEEAFPSPQDKILFQKIMAPPLYL